MFLGLPDLDPDPLVRGTDTDLAPLKLLSELKNCLQNKMLTLNFSKRLKITCLRVSYKKKNMKKIIFCILKVTEERIRI
jgi:hypothetical protein